MTSLNVSMYDPRLVQPMRDEMTRIGFEELRTPAEVDAVLGSTKETTLVVVNSVCGCAARNARPAAALAIQHAKHPQKLLTVFAGQDADATNRARQLFHGLSPVVPADRAVQGRQTGIHAGAKENRGTAGAGHCGGPHGGVRSVLLGTKSQTSDVSGQ